MILLRKSFSKLLTDSRGILKDIYFEFANLPIGIDSGTLKVGAQLQTLTDTAL